MGDKISNAQALGQGIAAGFGDMTEEQARKKKQMEDAAASAQQSQQASGQEPSILDQMKSFASFATGGDPLNSSAGKKLKNAK